MIASVEATKHSRELVKAADLYHQAERPKPDDLHVHDQIGLLFLQLKDVSEADEHLEKAVSLPPNFGPAFPFTESIISASCACGSGGNRIEAHARPSLDA
jgi:tetratricopeptide (TPR) repeat protein